MGLIYVFFIPPWQHYDEPTHFEYAWLIANQPQLVETEGYVQSLRREIAASMIEHSFFLTHEVSKPNLFSLTSPIWIGISQVDDRPLYYWLAAIPLRVLTYTGVETQLYAARLISLVFLIITLWAASGIAAEITSPKSILRWGLPLSIALLPGFTELMTAVNNDVGATGFFSLFLWAGIRTIKQGISLPRLGALILTALACYWTKITVSITLILFIVPLVLSLVGRERQRLAWYFFTFLALAGIFSVFTWGDAAHWARDNSFQTANTQVKLADAPFGKYVFQITKTPGEPVHRIYQFLAYNQVESLRGKDVTLGAWIWADKPMSIRSPSLGNGEDERYRDLEIDTQKRFYAFTARVPKDAISVFVILSSRSNAPDTSGAIYFDGLILAEGSYNPARSARFEDGDLRQGYWGNKPFTNLLTNASAEHSGPRFRSWADKLIAMNYPGSPSLMLVSALDWRQADWYFTSALRYLSQSFWGKFGWGQVRLIGRYTYWILLVVTMVGLAGILVRFSRQRRGYPTAILFFLIACILSIWGPTIMRGINSIYGQIFIPTARYAYPAIIPTMFFLCIGWQEITWQIRKNLNLSRYLVVAFWALFWLSLNGMAFYTLFNYYYQ